MSAKYSLGRVKTNAMLKCVAVCYNWRWSPHAVCRVGTCGGDAK